MNASTGSELPSATETFLEGILILDSNGNILSLNNVAGRLLAIDGQSAPGQKLHTLCKFASPDEDASFMAYHLPASIMRPGVDTPPPVIAGVLDQEGKPLRWLSVSSAMTQGSAPENVKISLTDVSAIVAEMLRLKNNRHNLKLLISSLDDIVFELTPDGQVINLWTSTPERLFFPPEAMIGKYVHELFAPALATRFLEVIGKSYNDQVVCDMEYESPFESHKGYWYNLQTRPVIGVKERVAAIISDITPQHKVREQLKETDLRWRFVQENSGQLLWDWDWEEQNILLFGPWANVLGIETSGIGPDDIKSRVHPDDVKAMVISLNRCIRNGDTKGRFECRIKHEDQTYRWLFSRFVVVQRENGVKRILGTTADITERIHIMEKVRMNEQKFNQAFQYSAIGMALVDLEGNFIEVNKTLSDILGYTPRTLTRMRFQECTHPEDLSKDLESLAQLTRGEINSYFMGKRYRHQNGHFIWCLLMVSMVCDPDGRPAFYISQIQDISLQKAQLVALERQNEALEVTANELSLKLDKLEEFNYIVAHNLRGPASNIQSLTEMALHADNQEERAEYITMLKRSSDGLTEIFRELSDVLDVSSNPTLEQELCNVEEVVDKVLTQFSAEIIFKQAVVTQHFQVKEISYPRIYLESIIYNLVSNALKYVVDGRQPKIDLATFPKEGYTLLTVADNGIGIDMKRHRDQLFKFKKVFHRGYDSRGIGLFLIRHQIERSGGSISAESTPGAGSVFTITIR